MEKYLHFILFVFLFISSFYTSNAQTERLKTYAVENISKKNITEEPRPNIPDKNKSVKFKQEIIKDKNHLKLSNISRDSIVNIKLTIDENNTYEQTNIQQINANKSSNTDATNSDNVTYNKETISENQLVTTSERSPIKVATSVNYQPRILKEDVHPVANNSSISITPNKRIYLQQEADDLQIEISQNVNNPNYDLAEKQKLLEYIKTLLKN